MRSGEDKSSLNYKYYGFGRLTGGTGKWSISVIYEEHVSPRVVPALVITSVDLRDVWVVLPGSIHQAGGIGFMGVSQEECLEIKVVKVLTQRRFGTVNGKMFCKKI